MVRPPDEPRRQVEGNPIRLDPQLGRGRPDPNRGAAGFRAPHRVRVVGRSRSRLSRIRTEPINEVNRDNAVFRRIFQNMHIRNRSNNIEHNSIVYRNYMEQPPQPHNVRQTRNKPRRLGLTNAEYQRSRPDAQAEANRQRIELRRLLESLTEPQGASSSNENSTRQQQAASSHVLDNQDQQPGTSGVSEKLNEEPQPGTSSSTGGCGSSNLISVCIQDGYWRPDLDMYSSSSEEDIADIDTGRFTRRNPKRRHSNRNIVQEVKNVMRTQAETQHKKARMTRTRNLSESSSESDNDEDVVECSQVKNMKVMKCTRSNAHRKSKEHRSNRDIVQEVKADMRAQAEMRRRETRLARNRNLPESNSDSDSDLEVNVDPSLEKPARYDSLLKTRRNPRRHHSNRDIVQEVKTDVRAHTDMRRKESRMARNRDLSNSECDVMIPSKISKQHPKNGSCQEAGSDISGHSSENDIQQANVDMHAQEVLQLEEANTNEDKIHLDTHIESDNENLLQ